MGTGYQPEFSLPHNALVNVAKVLLYVRRVNCCTRFEGEA